MQPCESIMEWSYNKVDICGNEKGVRYTNCLNDALGELVHVH